MQEVFLQTLVQVGVLVVFIIIGYALKITGKVSDGKVLSCLLLLVFLPAVRDKMEKIRVNARFKPLIEY